MQAAAIQQAIENMQLAGNRMSHDLEGLSLRIAALESEIRQQEGMIALSDDSVTAKPLEASVVTQSSVPPVIPPSPSPREPQTPIEQAERLEDQIFTPSPPRIPLMTDQIAKPAASTNNWEQFMGAKLFAWVGGLALFLGIALFVKYSFERDLISPAVRVSIGFLSGLILLAGGLVMRRRDTIVTAQTLASTGILVLYAVTFSCRAYYHFVFFDTLPTFLVMVFITVVAILISIRMDAVAVAVLGIAGGFLTPILISSGQDNPLLLFGYIGLLDIGLLAVALGKRWASLPILGGIGTMAMQADWIARFFNAGHYEQGNKVIVCMAVFAGFFALFMIATALGKKFRKLEYPLSATAAWVGSLALLAATFFLLFPSLGQRPLLLFGYVWMIDLGFLGLAVLDDRRLATRMRAGVSVFTLLALWTSAYLSYENLHAALALYFIFALFHTAAPVILHRWKGRGVSGWGSIFPALALLLVLIQIFKLPTVSLAIWPLVLLLDLLAVGLALASRKLIPVLITMLLTLVSLGSWIIRMPAELTGFTPSLVAVGGFSIFFVAVAIWMSRSPQLELSTEKDLMVQIPVMSATLPFVLLAMMLLRLPILNPTPIFIVSLLLALLMLLLVRIMKIEILSIVALGCTGVLEYLWYFQYFGEFQHFAADKTVLVLSWFFVFYALFTIFPFLFRRSFEASIIVWAVAALAGPVYFLLFYNLVKADYQNLHHLMGLLPAACAIPPLLGLWLLLRWMPYDSRVRTSQLAWFGGVSLFFLTLIFPIQFHHQWITLGWALEGAALCWLFHRIPHRGLALTGFFLLIAAFVRLALNPAVLDYYVRSATPILNWYLYAYGITAIALFTGAYLLAPPRNRIAGYNAPPLLWGLGTILCFLLLNIEIADYFSVPGTPVLTFDFEGNFARDLSYSISWALFALILLIIGIARRVAPVRYASIALLAIVLLKLFFHDFSTLDQLYRIAAFIVVAVIAILASFLYQRFLLPVSRTNQS